MLEYNILLMWKNECRPANNRVHVSSTLGTTDVWRNVIKYDPYANEYEGQTQVSPPQFVALFHSMFYGKCFRFDLQEGTERAEQGKGLMQLAKMKKLVCPLPLLISVEAMEDKNSFVFWLTQGDDTGESEKKYDIRKLQHRRNRLSLEAATTLGWAPKFEETDNEKKGSADSSDEHSSSEDSDSSSEVEKKKKRRSKSKSHKHKHKHKRGRSRSRDKKSSRHHSRSRDKQSRHKKHKKKSHREDEKASRKHHKKRRHRHSSSSSSESEEE